MTPEQMDWIESLAADCEHYMAEEASWRDLGMFELAAIYAEAAEGSAESAFLVAGGAGVGAGARS